MSILLPPDYAADRERYAPPRDGRGPGLIVIEVPGLSINWTLRPDRRDVRRFVAVDLAEAVQMHAAPATMLRDLAGRIPRPIGRRHWM